MTIKQFKSELTRIYFESLQSSDPSVYLQGMQDNIKQLSLTVTSLDNDLEDLFLLLTAVNASSVYFALFVQTV